MTAYKAPDFRERAALSKLAKRKALDQLREKTGKDPAPVAADAPKK